MEGSPSTLPMSSSEPGAPPAPVELRLRDLRPIEAPLIIVARVVSAQRKEITRRSDGGRRPVLSGLLSDGTATVRFTWWDPPAEELERGTILRAGPIQLREYRGRQEISFTWKTRVALASEADLPTLSPDDLPARRISELDEGDEGFRLEVRVARVAPRTVSVGQERRLLHEGILFDGSGAIPFTAWSDFGLAEGEAVRILGAYVGAFRNEPQLILDERAHVQRTPGSALPSLEEWRTLAPMPIGLLEAARGSDHVRVEGVVVGLLPPSGLVYRCPSCERGVAGGLCRTHGAVAGLPDLRARVALDDGTGTLTVNVDRAGTEKLWGRTLAEALADLKEHPDASQIEEAIHRTIFGRRLAVTGRATSDAFGVTLRPEATVPVTIEAPKDLPELREAVEVRRR
ncbi:MAG: hypothetical protein L3J73_05140 [Thermoplasmata archaeon]|nr:hypothetical protein [Thermoplasmata archaeon]